MALANKSNVSVVGTREPDVGVGGSILGGGHFYLPGYGLAADNVKSFEVALANGKVLNASAQENADLFWALKGGGPNFGIVTRYHLKTIPVDKIWFKILVYSANQAFDVINAVAQWQLQCGSSDLKSNILFIISLDAIILGLFYEEPLAGEPQSFAIFNSVKPVTVAVPATNGTFSWLYANIPSDGSNQRTRGASSLVDAQLYRDVYKFWLGKAQAAFDSTGTKQTFIIQHVPGQLAKYGAKQGGNPMGIPERTHQWWTTLVDWADASKDDLARSVSIETADYWERLSKERGLHVPHLYLNDASRDQNPIASYGAGNVQQLRKIAAKYDSARVFQRLQNDGFLLDKTDP
ncbi:hypothetical protein CDD83_7806 [Cordyceps sp. RAO-2017]|nr:hypothetical protein CDD83_7806 [Cordyceps sp. RAO-2017]